MYEFHCDCSKNKYDSISKLLFAYTDSLMYEIKTEDVYNDFRSIKKMFDCSIFLTTSKYCGDPNRLVIQKMKDENYSVAIEGFVRLKPKDVFIFSRRQSWT